MDNTIETNQDKNSIIALDLPTISETPTDIANIPDNTNTNISSDKNTPPMTKHHISPKMQKRLIIIGITVILVLLCVITIVFIIPSTFKNYIEGETDIVYFVYTGDETTVYINDIELKTFSGNVKRYYSSDYVYNYISQTDDDTGLTSLYRINNNELLLIANGITTFMNNAMYDDTICYIANNKLTLYSHGETTELSSNGSLVTKLKISNNGQYVVYVEVSDETSTMYLFCNDKITELQVGKSLTPIGISNDGKYIYAISEANTLYCLSDNIKSFISTDAMNMSLNIYGNEILYVTCDDENFYSKIYNADKNESYLINKGIYFEISSYYNNHYGNKTYKNTLIGEYSTQYESSIYMTNQSYEIEKVAGSYFVFDYNEKHLYYMDNNDLHQIKYPNYEDTDKIIASNVETFRLTNDGGIYYKSESDILYYSKNGNKFEKISYSISEYTVLKSTNTVLFMDDEKEFLQISVNGKEPEDFNIDGKKFTSLPTQYTNNGPEIILYFKYEDHCNIYYSDKDNNYGFVSSTDKTMPIFNYYVEDYTEY